MTGITAEMRDVVLHPGEGGNHVENSVLTRSAASLRGEQRVRQESQHTKPILRRYHHHTIRSERGGVERWLMRVASLVASSVKKDHDGLFRGGSGRRGEDVDEQQSSPPTRSRLKSICVQTLPTWEAS